MATQETNQQALRDEVAEHEWYHSIELAPGVETPGWHDTRPILSQIPFPASLAGKRCLDVGTFDGFWAFEMERRGAEEMMAIDILDPRKWDWPASSDEETLKTIGRRKGRGEGFEIARRELGSSVERRELSVYDLDPAEVGKFDLIFLGSLLIHLKNPALALERLRAVCAGTLITMDGIDLLLSLAFPRRPVATLHAQGRPWWWYSNEAALKRLVESSGFDVLEGPRRLFMPPGKGQPLPSFSPGLLKTREGRHALVIARRGDPHAVIVARPGRTLAT